MVAVAAVVVVAYELARVPQYRNPVIRIVCFRGVLGLA